MKKLFLLILVIFCFVSKNYSQDWINYDSNEGKFSVLLPAPPTVQTDTSKSYPNYITYFFLSKSKTDLFLIGWVDYETSYKFDLQKELEANRDNFIKGVNGTLIETKNITFKGYQGLEFSAQSASYFWTSKVFIIGRRPYQLVTGSSTGHASVDENKFYNSFSIKN